MTKSERPPNLSSDSISQRVMQEFLGAPVLENSLRGYWCEAMVAEALGKECRITSKGWAPWDLEIGPTNADYPARVRIQVKNAARRQTWHQENADGSDAIFSLVYRNRPTYWGRDFPDQPCEASGFLCDIFALCYHADVDPISADQRDPAQWTIYLVSAHEADGDITKAETAGCASKLRAGRHRATLNRKPESMSNGIRGRRPVRAIALPELNIRDICDVLANSRSASILT